MHLDVAHNNYQIDNIKIKNRTKMMRYFSVIFAFTAATHGSAVPFGPNDLPRTNSIDGNILNVSTIPMPLINYVSAFLNSYRNAIVKFHLLNFSRTFI